MADPTCDWCEKPAIHITRHERRNTGTLVVYWCDEHRQLAEPAPDVDLNTPDAI